MKITQEGIIHITIVLLIKTPNDSNLKVVNTGLFEVQQTIEQFKHLKFHRYSRILKDVLLFVGAS
jgi:hypothetical protein